MASIAGLVLGMVIFLVPASAFGQSFEGSEFCKDCHENNYNDWKASGHPYKLMKGEDARFAPFRFLKALIGPKEALHPLTTKFHM